MTAPTGGEESPSPFAGLVFGLIAALAPQPSSVDVVQQPTFRSGVELVEVDVSVHTDGRFVSDLRADEFVVLEDGELRSPRLLTLVREEDHTPGDRPDVHPGLSDVVSANPPGQIFILFFDVEHLGKESLNRAKRAADDFIAELGPRDIVAVAADQPEFRTVLTLDKELARRLMATLRPPSGDAKSELLGWPRMTEFEATRIDMGDERTFDEVLDRACEEQSGSCPEPAQTLVRTKASGFVNQARASTARTLGTLHAFAGRALGLSGRKNLILLSDGFYIGDSHGLVQQVAALMMRARIVVYGVDALGLRRSLGNWTDASGAGGPTLSAALDDTDSGMQIAAAMTGGFVVRNRNDLHQALRTVEADAGSYYILAYEPAPQGRAMRKIEIKVKRQNVNVRHRKWAHIRD